MFVNGPGNQSSIPGRVIPGIQKMAVDATLLNTQHYKVQIKGKVEQFREKSSAPLLFGVIATEKGAFGSPSTKVTNFTKQKIASIKSHILTKCLLKYNE